MGRSRSTKPRRTRAKPPAPPRSRPPPPFCYDCRFALQAALSSMPLLAYGVSFRSAAIELRERLAFPQETLTEALADLCEGVAPVAEAAILSTCNRTEIYCALDEADQEPVAQWIAANRAVDADELTGAAYALWDRDAAHHLMRVAAGLDSQVLGEPQIMGQVKAAYDLARASGTLGPELNLLAQTTFNVAKRVRTETEIGKHPVSVAYAAVRMAQTLFADLGSAHALLVGAGETIELAARHLRKAGIGAMSIANRTLERAERLGRAVGAEAMTLDQIAPRLAGFDIVISCTSAAGHIISKCVVQQAARQRQRPMFLVDLAVPRDIDPAATGVANVFLHSIDDLTEIVTENGAARRGQAERAEALIEAGAAHHERERRVQGEALLREVRQRAEAARDEAVARARRRLNQGEPAPEVLERLAQDLTNKLMHAPTAAIRAASADARTDMLECARTLYDLD